MQFQTEYCASLHHTRDVSYFQQIIEAVNEASDEEDDLQKADSEDETDEDIDFESDEEEPRSGSGNTT